MNELFFILAAVYLFGYYVAYSMNLIEIKSEGEIYTKGGRLMNISLSLFSWALVLYLLVHAWVAKVNSTGYWQKPVKEDQVNPEQKKEEVK